jgi:exodeoxyribonuclease VII small subunit
MSAGEQQINGLAETAGVAEEGKGEPDSQQRLSQPQTYEQASARVEEIIRRLDSGEASLDETLELIREGKALIELCAGQLRAVGDALQELRLDELVERLEAEARPE